MNEIKSVQIILKDKQFKYKIPSHSKILENKWECCVASICVQYLENIDLFVSLSTNLVSDIKYNLKGQVENFNNPLVQFLLKGKVKETQFFEFEKTWFRVNNPNEEINLFVRKVFGNNSSVTSEVKVQMSVLLLLKKI